MHSTPFNITNKIYDFINSALRSLLLMKWPVIIVILSTVKLERKRKKRALLGMMDDIQQSKAKIQCRRYILFGLKHLIPIRQAI